MTLQYWFMLPVSVLVATVAMASGIGGATFFAPMFILVLGFSPEVAIGISLITQVFGFVSGVSAYARKRLIDYRLGLNLLVAAVPLALLGTWVVIFVSPEFLKVVLGAGLFAVGLAYLKAPDHQDVGRKDDAIHDNDVGENAHTCIITSEGEEIRYEVCNRVEGGLFAGIGGLFFGMISTGLGELNGYFLMQRCRVPSKIAVATSVFVVALTALIAATGHIYQYARSGSETLVIVFSVVIFTIPGVIIGAQFGSQVASRIPQKTLERSLGVLLIFIAALTLGEVVL